MMARAVANGAAASHPGERPEWLCEGGRARWWSERQNKHLQVTVSRIDEEKKRVVVTFDADPTAWKSVPYNKVGGNGLLQPAKEKVNKDMDKKRKKDEEEGEEEEDESSGDVGLLTCGSCGAREESFSRCGICRDFYCAAACSKAHERDCDEPAE